MKKPFYIKDVEALRRKLANAEKEGSMMGKAWSSVRRRAQASPLGFPWYTAFVALITQEERDIEAARQSIRNYVSGFHSIQYGLGLQFHFWCFAFPHARWALYFQWLDSMGAWTKEEGDRLRGELVAFQFNNFFYGLRTKPEPECVDNQTMSLAFSNASVGHLFEDSPDVAHIAKRMKEDGIRRLPGMLGGIPPHGYSFEGSAYMDGVVGPSVPYIVELLESVHGGDWYSKALPPNGGSAASIIRMIAREWTPSGLYLPWDHYGYGLPCRTGIAYGAHRTGEAFYSELLERHANWGFDTMPGWGFDDFVWTLVWWPEASASAARANAYPSWVEEEIGGAIVARDASLYLMQMWDETNVPPLRAQCNPNSLVLCAFGSPLSVDGMPDQECQAVNYPDAWIERVGVQSFGVTRSSFGSSCCGAHNVLFVDGKESMHAVSAGVQAALVKFDADGKEIIADATQLYRGCDADALCVRRRSRLCHDRFWLIEDQADYANEHEITARWWLRPEECKTGRGVCIETAEGVRLNLLPLVGADEKTTLRVKGFPDRLDGASLQVSFRQRGKKNRWLWLAFPEATRHVVEDIRQGWDVRAEGHEGAWTLPFTMPAFTVADVPVAKRWWYRRKVKVPEMGGAFWLQLPMRLINPVLRINGVEVDMAPHDLLGKLMAPHIALPQAKPGMELEIEVRTDCSVAQYYQRGDDGDPHNGGSCFWGMPALLAGQEPQGISEATYKDGIVTVRSGKEVWTVEHKMMEG